MSDETLMRPADWLPYKARAAFTLFELACLLNKQNPSRVTEVAHAEDLAREKRLDQEAGFSSALSLEQPGLFLAKLEWKPEWLLPIEICQILKALKTATGQSMMANVRIERARELSAILELQWPVELHSAQRTTPADAASSAAPQRLLPRSQAQEFEILRALRDAGHDPKKLPKNAPGKPGVKAQAKAEVNRVRPDIFQGTTFDKAWERLRGSGDIADSVP